MPLGFAMSEWWRWPIGVLLMAAGLYAMRWSWRWQARGEADARARLEDRPPTMRDPYDPDAPAAAEWLGTAIGVAAAGMIVGGAWLIAAG